MGCANQGRMGGGSIKVDKLDLFFFTILLSCAFGIALSMIIIILSLSIGLIQSLF